MVMLLLSLYLLKSNSNDEPALTRKEGKENQNGDEYSYYHHHLLVITALNRHRPSFRIYRSFFELNLLLWGSVVSLFLWSRTVGNKMIDHLLFQKPKQSYFNNTFPTIFGRYRSLNTTEEIILSTINEEHNSNELHLSEAEEEEEEKEEEMTSEDNHHQEEGVPDDEDQDCEEETVVEFQPPIIRNVACAAFDSFIVILLSLLFFTLSSSGKSKAIALIAAPVFPLLLFTGGIFFALHGRQEFWKVVGYTVFSPLFPVSFRDGFVGDICTSSVRPMQDFAFTTFYLLWGIKAWWKHTLDGDYIADNDDTGGGDDDRLESNWLLHTCILPICMVSPLWWRFLQNLRQCYENKQRWPYLGNAFKYFFAAQVASFGVFHPSLKENTLWLSCFVIATLYQIWWDVFMDWELFEVNTTTTRRRRGLRLRKTRIYSHQWMYWSILVINFCLRFCWTLSFLPHQYLDRSGVLKNTFEGDISAALNPLLASAEIIRRTLWGFLRVELEAIKVARKDPQLKGVWVDRESSPSGDIELSTFREAQVTTNSQQHPSQTMNHPSIVPTGNRRLLVELFSYAATFIGTVLLAACYRKTA